MVSNSLSLRRDLLARPIVCKKGPPPIPTPPGPWPPDVFPLHLVADFAGYEGPIHIDRTENLTRDSESNTWLYEEVTPGEDQNWIFTLYPDTQTAELVIMTCGDEECAECSVSSFAIVWGVSSVYLIVTWDSYYPGDLTASAAFTF